MIESNKHLSDSAECSGMKRKHVMHTIMQKVSVPQKLDKGKPVHSLGDYYGVGNRTIYDIKKLCEKLLKFYTGSDSNRALLSAEQCSYMFLK